LTSAALLMWHPVDQLQQKRSLDTAVDNSTYCIFELLSLIQVLVCMLREAMLCLLLLLPLIA
jgi:hypothetical protein